MGGRRCGERTCSPLLPEGGAKWSLRCSKDSCEARAALLPLSSVSAESEFARANPTCAERSTAR